MLKFNININKKIWLNNDGQFQKYKLIWLIASWTLRNLKIINNKFLKISYRGWKK